MSLPRLSEAVTSLLARASEEARRRSHRTTEAEHLLAALAESDDHASLLFDRGVDRAELRLLVDASLGTWDAPTSYRGGVGTTPPLGAALTHDISALRRSWMSRLRALDVDELVDLLAVHPACGSLLRRATSIVQSLVATLRRARTVTQARAVSIEHVLRLLADERWFVFATRAAGGDVDHLRTVLDDAIVERAKEGDDDRATVELTALTQRTFTHAQLAGKRPMADMFVIKAMQTKHIAALFDRAGVGSDKLLLVLVHGKLVVDDDAGELAAHEPCEVVFHNDDLTPMDVVVDVLMSCFDLDREAATSTMLMVHGHDLAVVATLPTREARRRAILARELVRTRGAPLRISLRRAARAASTRT